MDHVFYIAMSGRRVVASSFVLPIVSLPRLMPVYILRLLVAHTVHHPGYLRDLTFTLETAVVRAAAGSRELPGARVRVISKYSHS